MPIQLITSILGPYNQHSLSLIMACVADNKCNVLDSRHAKFGTDFTLTLIIDGGQSDITRLELSLSQLCVNHDLHCMMKRTSKHEKQDIEQYILLKFSGKDSSGLLQKITSELNLMDVHVHAIRQQTQTHEEKTEVNCKMILLAPKSIDLPLFDSRIKNLLSGLGLHGQISHKTQKENDEYIESW